MRRVLGLCLAMVAGAPTLAGPLDPPAGPIAPTPGPEPRTPISAATTPGDANSVFKISQPGSYYLSGNVSGQVGKHGIEIAASNVTVDLNGFQVVGVSGSLTGVESTSSSVTVRNGSVANWGQAGVDLGVSARVDNVNARANAGDGISVSFDSLITSCGASFNARGIVCTSCCVSIIGCHVQDNNGDGITGSSSTNVVNTLVTSNLGTGVSLGFAGTVRGCTVTFNGQHGITSASRSFVSGNLAASNALAGVRITGSDCRVEGNNVIDNSTGVEVTGTGNFLAANTCSGNTTFNWSVAANNKCLVVLGVNAAAISGDSGGVSPGSSNPFANFTY